MAESKSGAVTADFLKVKQRVDYKLTGKLELTTESTENTE